MIRDALSDRQIDYPRKWSDIAQGDQIKHELERAIKPMVERIFGYHLVKLGSLSAAITIKQSCIANHLCIQHIQKPLPTDGIVANSKQLPLQQNSVDAVLLTAELDFAQDPHQILREIEACLTADGHIIVAGFNPLSIAGLLKYLPLNKANLLHQARFFSLGRIKDWLQLLNFEVITVERIMYSPLFTGKDNPWAMRIQNLCKRFFPAFSSMYVLVARKRVLPLSVVKSPWRARKPKFATSGVTARQKC